MISNADTIKYNLDIVDKMISHVQSKVYTDNTMMGMVQSGDEHDETSKEQKLLNANALRVLVNYRAKLLNYAAGLGEEPSLELPDGFNF